MITSVGSFTVRSGGYDLLETGSENPSATALWLRKKMAECEAKAKAYFATKERKRYYVFSGRQEQLDREVNLLFSLTDEEVARVRQLTVDTYKMGIKDYNEEEWASTFEEVCEDAPLYEMEGRNPELDKLIFDPCNNLDFQLALYSIDLNHSCNLYKVTYQEYGQKPKKEEVELTDEQYIYLLTQRLLFEHFNFNRLLLYRPELAQYISVQLDGCCNDYLFESYNPYLIVFDEVNEDVAKIREQDKGKE